MSKLNYQSRLCTETRFKISTGLILYGQPQCWVTIYVQECYFWACQWIISHRKEISDPLVSITDTSLFCFPQKYSNPSHLVSNQSLYLFINQYESKPPVFAEWPGGSLACLNSCDTVTSENACSLTDWPCWSRLAITALTMVHFLAATRLKGDPFCQNQDVCFLELHVVVS